jgi:LysM repeat protein
LDYKALAKRNGISPPYTIYAGQKLKLSVAAKSKPSSRQTASVKTESNAVYKKKAGGKAHPEALDQPHQLAVAC